MDKPTIKVSKRAIRRHHRERLKNKRKHYYNVYDKRSSCSIVNTPKPCSCWMCGNPRRHSGELTHQKWLALSESAFDFWDNEDDAIYDEM